jgi:orotidine-5'-phosphate decarboxylase
MQICSGALRAVIKLTEHKAVKLRARSHSTHSTTHAVAHTNSWFINMYEVVLSVDIQERECNFKSYSTGCKGYSRVVRVILGLYVNVTPGIALLIVSALATRLLTSLLTERW